MREISLSSCLSRLLCTGAIVLVLASCVSRIDSRGNYPDPDRLAELKIGEHSREQVSDMIGSPSSIAAFDEDIWYYIGKRTETVAFMEPELKDRKILVIRFDKNGKLSQVSNLGLEDGRNVRHVERETPTVGNTLSIFDQAILNFTRFRKKTAQKMGTE